MSEAVVQGSEKTSGIPPVVTSLILPLFGLLIALIGVEIAFRLIGGDKPAPGVSDRPEFYYAHNNAETFKGAGYPAEKPAGEFRIAVVGDSFTFATAMQADDSFPAKLGRLFERVYPDQKIRVINYGVPGYSVGNNFESKRSPEETDPTHRTAVSKSLRSIKDPEEGLMDCSILEDPRICP
jgi:hypothetical protein